MANKLNKVKKLGGQVGMKPESHTDIELNLNQKLQPIWIDDFNLNIRADNLCLIRFLTSLPEGVFEQTRVMTSKNNLKKLIDLMCSLLQYYPSPRDVNDKNKNDDNDSDAK
jgi:hypothetical protein